MTWKFSAANKLAVMLAGVAIVAVGFDMTPAGAQPKRQYDDRGRAYYGPNGPNVSYQQGPRTRIYVTKRSWLDAGTEVLPGDRKFTDYAFPPELGYPSFARETARRMDPGSRFAWPGRRWGKLPLPVQHLQFLQNRLTHLRGAHRGGALGLDVGGAQTAGEHRRDRSIELVGQRAHIERIAQRHSKRCDHRDRIGQSLAGDIRRRAVHRLIQGFPLPGFDIDLAKRGRRQHAERTRQHRRDIREHVAEQVVGDDDVECLRRFHQIHAAGIGQLMLELDVPVFARMHLGDHLVPEHAGFHDVALFHRGQLVAALARQVERDAGDALDFIGVVNLRIDGALLAVAEIGDGFGLTKVHPAGELAHDHDVEALDHLALQARGIRKRGIAHRGAQVREQAEFLAQPQ